MNVTGEALEKEYLKNEGCEREDVLSLLEWTRTQPHLPEINEFQALLFWQSCFYDADVAKTAIENYFTLRAANPLIFSNKDPTNEKLEQTMDACLIAPLSKPTKEGYTVIFARFMDNDPAKFDLATYIKLMDMTLTLMLKQRGTSEGLVVVVDQEGATLKHILKTRFWILQAYLKYAQEALPMRIRNVHYFNTKPFMDAMFNVMRRFVKKDLVHLLTLHPKIDTVFGYVPRECFPSDFGGEEVSTRELQARQKRNMLENAGFFAEDEKQMADESKRPARAKGDEGLLHKTFKAMGFR